MIALREIVDVYTVAASATPGDSQNVTASVNSNVSLKCTIQTADPLRWKLFLENSTQFLTIFSGTQLNPTFQRFTVKTDEDTGQSEMTIHNLQYEDSGTYFCDFINGTVIYFTLTVIGQ